MQAWNGRICSCCNHARVGELNAALAAGKVSNRRAAQIFSVSESAIRRHRKNHLKHATPAAAEDEQQRIERIQDIDRRLESLVFDGWL